MRADLAQIKATRRRNLRETFPHPLNQIALRHVDSIATLSDVQRLILCKAVIKTDLRSAATLIDILINSAVSIQSEDDLVAQFTLLSQADGDRPGDDADTNESIAEDTTCLTSLLLKCYPDMPATSADALARAEVMKTALRVVQGTRCAIETANSDFVVVTLYTLFEEKRNELKDLINGNPAFIKAIQLSRPDWKSGH